MVVKHTLRIEAERATLELEHVFHGEHAGATIRLMAADEDRVRPLTVPAAYFGGSDPADFLDIYGTEPVGVLGFVAAIQEDRRPVPDFSDGVAVQEVIDAARRSDAEGRVVTLA
jgi:predicted dehydrogenase